VGWVSPNPLMHDTLHAHGDGCCSAPTTNNNRHARIYKSSTLAVAPPDRLSKFLGDALALCCSLSYSYSYVTITYHLILIDFFDSFLGYLFCSYAALAAD